MRFSTTTTAGSRTVSLVPGERRKRAQKRERKEQMRQASRSPVRNSKRKKNARNTAGRAASCSPKQQETRFHFNRIHSTTVFFERSKGTQKPALWPELDVSHKQRPWKRELWHHYSSYPHRSCRNCLAHQQASGPTSWQRLSAPTRSLSAPESIVGYGAC